MDFPAAHSMDTSWYAVDKCGHVAVFWSGEDGPVPEAAQRCEDTLEADRPFAGELDRCLREGMIRPGVHQTKVVMQTDSRHGETPERKVPVVHGFFLLGPGLKSDQARIRPPDLLNPWYWSILPPAFGTADGRDWVEGAIHPESWTWLHQAPHRCLGCVRGLELYTERRLEELRVIRFGNDHYSKRPYEKDHDPYQPATLEDLRRVVTWPLPPPLVFPAFCFREKQVLQPLQWVPCNVYGTADEWVDEEGTQRKGGAMLSE